MPNSSKQSKAIEGRSAVDIATSVEDGIRQGRLLHGGALPTVRALAAQLDVSPTTVAAAYRLLRERGLLVTAGRRGTRIAPAPPVASSPVPEVPPGTRDLATGNPDALLLPRLGPYLSRLAPEPHLYSDEIHSPALLALARERLRVDGLPHSSLAVVSGAMDGIERVLAARLRAGDRVAVEDPGFPGVLHLARALGLVLVPFPVDDSGPIPESFERALAGGAAAVILTPRAQNPTGASLSPARAASLRQILQRTPEVLLIEDDHCEVAAGTAALSLCGDTVRHWAIVRSVSKTLGPDLRLALLSGDTETIARVSGRQLLGSRWVSHLLQALVVSLWSDPKTEKRLARAAERYTQRRNALIEALATHGIEAHGRSGLNVWVPVPEETSVALRLAAAGYAVKAGEGHRLESPPAIRITTASLDVDEAPKVAALLAEALGRSAGSSA